MGDSILPFVGAAAEGQQNTMNAIMSVVKYRADAKMAQKQYERQRKDALSDWNMQNAYNSPAAQMQRLKEAGLNPNLVYGNGATATASSQPRSSDYAETKFNAPIQSGAGSAVNNSISNYYDAQVKQATIDNLAVQKTVMLEEAKLKAAQTVSTLQGTEVSKFDLGVKSDLRQTTLDAARANLNNLLASTQKTLADTKFTTDTNRRTEQMQPGNLKEQAQRITMGYLQQARTKQETEEISRRIQNLINSGDLQKIELEIRRRGGNPNDSYWQKKLQEFLQETFKQGTSPLQSKSWEQFFDRISPY